MRVRNDAVLDDMAGGPPRRRAAIKALPLLCPRRTEHAAGDSHRRGTGQPYDPDGSRRTTQRSHNGRNGSARIFDRLGTARAHQTLVSAQNQRGLFGVGMGFYWGFVGESGEEEEREGFGSCGAWEWDWDWEKSSYGWWCCSQGVGLGEEAIAEAEWWEKSHFGSRPPASVGCGGESGIIFRLKHARTDKTTHTSYEANC